MRLQMASTGSSVAATTPPSDGGGDRCSTTDETNDSPRLAPPPPDCAVLVKLWSVDRTQKKLVSVSTPDELKAIAVAKGLTDVSKCLKIFLEDGTEVEDDVFPAVLDDPQFEKTFFVAESWTFPAAPSPYSSRVPPPGAGGLHLASPQSFYEQHRNSFGASTPGCSPYASGMRGGLHNGPSSHHLNNHHHPGHHSSGAASFAAAHQHHQTQQQQQQAVNAAAMMAAFQQQMSNHHNDDSEESGSLSNQLNSVGDGLPPSPATQLIEGAPLENGGGGSSPSPVGGGGGGSASAASNEEAALAVVASMVNGAGGGGRSPPNGVGAPPPHLQTRGVWSQQPMPPFQIPWDRLPDCVIQTLEAGRKLDKRDRLEMIRIICSSMERTLGTRPARRQIAEVAREMVAKYPQSLRDEPGEATVFGQGFDRVFKYLEARVVNSSKSVRKRTFGEICDRRAPPFYPDFW